MKNVFRVIKRDLWRLIKAPTALIVVAALIVLPSLYTWVNVYGFWNPYDNTANMRVCFVTEDKGGTNELTGELNLGNMIDETLRENHQLGWAFMSRQEAMEEVQSGKAYAAFIVPENFTQNLLTLFSSDFEEPKIQYYVNEKLGAVSPKVTDAGSTTLDETINSTFVQTVSETVINKLNEAIGDVNEAANLKDDQVVQKIESARNAITNTNTSLVELEASIDNAQTKVANTKSNLSEVNKGIDEIESSLTKVKESSQKVSDSLNQYTEVVFPALNTGLTGISDASNKTNEAITNLAADVQSAQVSVKSALEQQKVQLSQAQTLIEQLQKTAESLPDGDEKTAVLAAIDSLKLRVEDSQATIDELEQLSSDISTDAGNISAASTEVNKMAQDTVSATLSFNSTLLTTTLPALTKTLSDVSALSGRLSATVGNQRALVTQIGAVLDQVQNSFSSAKKAVSSTKSSLEIFDKELSNVQTDISSFSLSTMLKKVIADNGLDASAIGEFISSPTIVEQKSIYELNAYGSAMAPLFMNLTFWIGGFMLLVILKQEVDDEGIDNLTIPQRYIARWLLMCIFAIMQAVICDIGVLALGVQTVNLPALILISCLASIAYLSLMFMLSATLQHVGKGLCVLLAFLQIPGATGLYPVEMTTPFFQSVYPAFPFTYGINGMRETICGFYGNTFAICCAVLIGIMVVSALIGVYLRPYLTNFNKLFAKEIREGGLFVGEEIEIPTQRFRLTQLIGYLSNRDEYRQGLMNRANKFVRRYASFKRYATAFGVIASILIAVLFSNMPVALKPTLLTIWLATLVVLMIVAVAVEHAYDSIERQLNLDEMSDDEIRGLFGQRNKVGKTTSEIFSRQHSGRGHRLFKDLHKKREEELAAQRLAERGYSADGNKHWSPWGHKEEKHDDGENEE